MGFTEAMKRSGIFLGRTCGVGVLSMIDPSVGLALTESRVNTLEPITGVYFYGESWFPLNEVFGIPSSCMLTLKGGAGSGFFAFIGKREGEERRMRSSLAASSCMAWRAQCSAL